MARLVGAATLRLLAVAWAALAGYAPEVLEPAPVDDEFVIRGLCYHPVPLRTPTGYAELVQDDWMSERSKPLWGPRYRGDLRVVRSLGANMVRLLSINPDSNHVNFLDEAFSVGLHVAVGMDSRHQDGPTYCRQSGFNCYDEFKDRYSRALQSGFLMADRTYHPAVKYVTIYDVSEHRGGDVSDKDIARAIVSALDGMLDAEREQGVTGSAINFTVTFSNLTFSKAGMQEMQTAMQHPDAFNGYEPTNDLALAYDHRWTHSFIGEGGAQVVQSDLIDTYQLHFPSTPMFITEFRKPADVGFDEVGEILKLAENSTLFLGLFYFQYQVSNWDSGSKGQSGLFGLGEHIISTMDYFGKEYNVWCLKPLPVQDQDDLAKPSRAEWLAKVYGGEYVDLAEEDVCDHNAAAVLLNQNGYETIAKQNSTKRMAEFLSRMVLHLGAVIVDEAGLAKFAEVAMDRDVSSFELLNFTLQSQRPDWASFDESGARCIADRSADSFAVVAAMQRACESEAGGNVTKERCKNVPRGCESDTFAVADYVFSSFFAEARKATSEGAGDPLGPNCYRNGVGVYASSAIWWNLYPACVADAEAFLGRDSPPGLPDGYSGLSLVGLPIVHPRTGSDQTPWSILNASTVSTTSIATTGPLSSEASEPNDTAAAAAHAELGSGAAAGAAGNGFTQLLRLCAAGHGWVGILAFAAVVLCVAVVTLRASPRCCAGAGGKAGRRGREPPSTASSEEDGDNSASSSESESDYAPKAARLSLGQQATTSRAPMLPIDRRLRRPSVYREHSVAQAAARVDAVAMPTAVRMQTPTPR